MSPAEAARELCVQHLLGTLDDDVTRRVAVAASRYVADQRIADAMLRDRSVSVQRALVGNPACPEEVLARFEHAADVEIRSALEARRPSRPAVIAWAERVELLAGRGRHGRLLELCEDWTITHGEARRILDIVGAEAKDACKVRLVGNPSCPPGLIERVATTTRGHQGSVVWQRIALNPATPGGVLTTMVSNLSPWYMTALANPSCPPSALAVAIRVAPKERFAAAAANPAMDDAALVGLVEHLQQPGVPEPLTVAAAVTANPSAGPATLCELRDLSIARRWRDVLGEVCAHPNADRTVVESVPVPAVSKPACFEALVPLVDTAEELEVAAGLLAFSEGTFGEAAELAQLTFG